MLLRDGRDDKSRMKVDQRCAKGTELGISASHLEVLVRLLARNAYGVSKRYIYQKSDAHPGSDGIYYKTAAGLAVLPSISDENRQFGILI